MISGALFFQRFWQRTSGMGTELQVLLALLVGMLGAYSHYREWPIEITTLWPFFSFGQLFLRHWIFAGFLVGRSCLSLCDLSLGGLCLPPGFAVNSAECGASASGICCFSGYHRIRMWGRYLINNDIPLINDIKGCRPCRRPRKDWKNSWSKPSKRCKALRNAKPERIPENLYMKV